ncbi:MAG: hypothetical protein IPI49_17540 [Myxococcales bacterium]|nr:hypothetical protein [Myxococcales bacterium]
MTTISDEVLQLARQIFAARAHLKELEESLARLLAGKGADASAPIAQDEDSDKEDRDEEDDDIEKADEGDEDNTGGTAAAQVLASFQRQAGKRVQLQSVVDELSHIDPGLVRSTSARYARMGKLKKVKRGVYRYVETEE